jgi:hypothetical protein
MDAPAPPDFAALIVLLSQALETHDLPFMLIGGQAVLLHGQPRLTQDIDVTLAAAPDRLTEVIAVCDQLGLDPLPTEVERFVRNTFVLPAAESSSGIRVDFIFSTTPYERQAINRAVRVPIGGRLVPFATAEDLILHKLFAGRPRDLEDAAGIVHRKGTELDWTYLQHWAEEFSTVTGRERLPQQIAELLNTIT